MKSVLRRFLVDEMLLKVHFKGVENRLENFVGYEIAW